MNSLIEIFLVVDIMSVCFKHMRRWRSSLRLKIEMMVSASKHLWKIKKIRRAKLLRSPTSDKYFEGRSRAQVAELVYAHV